MENVQVLSMKKKKKSNIGIQMVSLTKVNYTDFIDGKK